MTARRPAESLAEQSYVRKVQSLKHNSADWLVRPRPRHPVAGRASMLLYALLGLIGYAEARGGGWDRPRSRLQGLRTGRPWLRKVP